MNAVKIMVIQFSQITINVITLQHAKQGYRNTCVKMLTLTIVTQQTH